MLWSREEQEELLHQMTLEEKATLVNGATFFGMAENERLKIPRLQLLDGGTGSKGVDKPCTAFLHLPLLLCQPRPLGKQKCFRFLYTDIARTMQRDHATLIYTKPDLFPPAQ